MANKKFKIVQIANQGHNQHSECAAAVEKNMKNHLVAFATLS